MLARRHFGALVAAALLGAGAHAQSQRSYAVISEMAREVSLYTYQPQVGSRLNANPVTRLPIADGIFDKVALLKAKETIEKNDPGARIWLIAPAATDFFDARASVTEGGSFAIPDDLAAGMKERGTTRLLVLNRARAPAKFQFANTSAGEGTIEGAGFYVDRGVPVKNNETLQNSAGYMAPYLYVRATLVDAPSGRILATRRVLASRVVIARTAEESQHPWNLLTAADKANALGDMIKAEVERSIVELLAYR